MKVIIKNFQKKIPINPRSIRKAVLNTLSLEGINPVRNTKAPREKNKISNGVKKSGEITICFTNDKQIRELNLMYRGQYNPTDVISFDISENNKEILADIAVSADTAIRNSRIYKTAPLYEIYLYVIHGVLHLLGYDDRTEKERKIMQDKADSILNADFRKSNADSRRLSRR